MTVVIPPEIIRESELPCCMHDEEHDEFVCDIFRALTEPVCDLSDYTVLSRTVF